MSTTEKGIECAQKLYCRSVEEHPSLQFIKRSIWQQVIGMDWLGLCCVSAGDLQTALALADQSQRLQNNLWREKVSGDSTARTCSLFFYGYVLYACGQHERALQVWSTIYPKCSPGKMLSNNPFKKCNRRLELVTDTGCDSACRTEQRLMTLVPARAKRNMQRMREIMSKSFCWNMSHVIGTYAPELSDSERSATVKLAF